MLRLIIFILLVYFILRSLSRWSSSWLKKARPKRSSPFSSDPRPHAAPPRTIDEMKPCATCGAYVPTRLAVRKNELYFCSEQCHEASFKKEKV